MDFPDLNAQANKNRDFYNRVRLIVHDIQQYNQRLEDVEEHRTHWEPFQGFPTSPKLNVCKKKQKKKQHLNSIKQLTTNLKIMSQHYVQHLVYHKWSKKHKPFFTIYATSKNNNNKKNVC